MENNLRMMKNFKLVISFRVLVTVDNVNILIVVRIINPHNLKSWIVVISRFFGRIYIRDSPMSSDVFQPLGRRKISYSVRPIRHSRHTKLVPNATQTLRLQTERVLLKQSLWPCDYLFKLLTAILSGSLIITSLAFYFLHLAVESFSSPFVTTGDHIV